MSRGGRRMLVGGNGGREVIVGAGAYDELTEYGVGQAYPPRGQPGAGTTYPINHGPEQPGCGHWVRARGIGGIDGGHSHSAGGPASGGGGKVIHEDPYCDVRLFPLGFGPVAIAAGATADVESKPQVLFRGERLAVPASIAGNFDIVDVSVGKDSQLAAKGSVLAAELFSNLSVGVRMELDTAQPGIVITLRVNNTQNTSQTFRAGLYGVVAE